MSELKLCTLNNVSLMACQFYLKSIKMWLAPPYHPKRYLDDSISYFSTPPLKKDSGNHTLAGSRIIGFPVFWFRSIPYCRVLLLMEVLVISRVLLLEEVLE